MDISPASCLQLLPSPFYMALKRWQGYNSRPSFKEQRKLLFHDPRCFCWQFFAMKVDTSAKRLAGGCLWKMHRPDSPKVSAVEGIAWNARLLLCCVTLNYIHMWSLILSKLWFRQKLTLCDPALLQTLSGDRPSIFHVATGSRLSASGSRF